MLFKFYLILDHSYYSWAYRANTNSLWKDQTFFSTRPDWFCIHILYFILLRCLCFIPPLSELPLNFVRLLIFTKKKNVQLVFTMMYVCLLWTGGYQYLKHDFVRHLGYFVDVFQLKCLQMNYICIIKLVSFIGGTWDKGLTIHFLNPEKSRLAQQV
jgi:hypothetical protein